MSNMSKILKLVDDLESTLAKLKEETNRYREDFLLEDTIGQPLSESDAWILHQIAKKTDPAFHCDVLKSADIADALYRVDPKIGVHLTPMRVGHFMRKMHRFVSVRMTNGQSTFRGWILRNFDLYISLGGSAVYEEYARQKRDKLPPSIECYHTANETLKAATAEEQPSFL